MFLWQLDKYLYFLSRTGAFKADLFRYCVLLIRGGVYADMDVLLQTNLDEAIANDIGFMTPVDEVRVVETAADVPITNSHRSNLPLTNNPDSCTSRTARRPNRTPQLPVERPHRVRSRPSLPRAHHRDSR